MVRHTLKQPAAAVKMQMHVYAEPLDKKGAFHSLYVPFNEVKAGKKDSQVQYSLVDVVYRSRDGGLLDGQHDIAAPS